MTQAGTRDAKTGLRPAACREGQLRSSWLWTDLVPRAVKAELWKTGCSGCSGCPLLGAGAGVVGQIFLGVALARARTYRHVNSYQGRGVGYREQG